MATYDIRIIIYGNTGYVKSQLSLLVPDFHDNLGITYKLVLRSNKENPLNIN